MPRRSQGPRLRFLEKRGCYYIFWTEGGRSRERSTGTTDRDEAEAVFADFLHQRNRADGPSDPAGALVTDVLDDYLTARGEKVVAGDRLAYAAVPLCEFWQGRSVAEINDVTCEEYRQWRPVKDGTVRRELGVLRAAVNLAHKRGRLTRSVSVEMPPVPPSKDRWLTREDAAALLRAALKSPKSRLYLPLFIVMALHTGRRKEQILSLRWPQVDLVGRMIDWTLEGRAETNKRRGRSRIPSRLLPHLKRARQRGCELGHVINRNGERVGDPKKAFRAACLRAGLEPFGPHVLRHTRATWGMQAGADKWQLSGFLAMTLETLERVYGHHHPDFQGEVADQVARSPQHVRRLG